MKNVTDVERILDAMIRSSSYNPHGNVLVLINVNLGDDDWEPLVKSFFQLFWQHFIINVSIMFPNFKRSINTVRLNINFQISKLALM